VIEIDPGDGEGMRLLPVTQILKALSNRHEQLPEAFFKSAPEYDASRYSQRGRSLHGHFDECGILMSEGDTFGIAADKIIAVIEDRIKIEAMRSDLAMNGTRRTCPATPAGQLQSSAWG
jgi:hypothetical protein